MVQARPARSRKTWKRFSLRRCENRERPARRAGPRRGDGRQALRLIMDSEQGIEALAQGSVAVACAIQKTGALDAAKLGGRLKQSLFSGRFRLHG